MKHPCNVLHKYTWTKYGCSIRNDYQNSDVKYLK